jgi:hypothetical protein
LELLNFPSCWSALLPAMATTTLDSANFSTLMRWKVPLRPRTPGCRGRTGRWWDRRPWWCRARPCSRRWWWCGSAPVRPCPRSAAWPRCRWWRATSIAWRVLESEVHPDGRQVTLLELVVGKPAQEGALPHRTVTDDHYLEQVVVLPNHTNNNKSDHLTPRHHSPSISVVKHLFLPCLIYVFTRCREYSSLLSRFLFAEKGRSVLLSKCDLIFDLFLSRWRRSKLPFFSIGLV